LAGYFIIADTVLISQCMYYNTINARRAARLEQGGNDEDAAAAEDSPLLSRRRSSEVGLPGSQRRHATHQESSVDPLRKMVTGEDDTPDSNPWLHNTLSLLAVYGIGFVGWFISYKAGAWDSDEPGVPDSPTDTQNVLEIIGLILGYLSAICYLLYVATRILYPVQLAWVQYVNRSSARIPQIVKNYREKSCEGMSMTLNCLLVGWLVGLRF
jgi:hypothetical protein